MFTTLLTHHRKYSNSWNPAEQQLEGMVIAVGHLPRLYSHLFYSWASAAVTAYPLQMGHHEPVASQGEDSGVRREYAHRLLTAWTGRSICVRRVIHDCIVSFGLHRRSGTKLCYYDLTSLAASDEC